MPFLVSGAAFLICGTTCGTKYDYDMIESNEETDYRFAVLKDRKGDLSKIWYIEWYLNTQTSKVPIRKRVKVPLIYVTAKERRNFAKKEIEKINRLLAKGHVFIDKNFTPVADFIKPASENAMLFEALYNQIEVSQHLRKKSGGSYKSSVNQAKQYFIDLAKQQKTTFTDLPLDSLTKSVILKIRDYYIIKGNVAVTANKKVDQLERIYLQVLERHDKKENPFEGIKSLVETQVSTANIAFVKEDQHKLEKWMIANDPQLYAFTRFMYYAFIRPKELRNLTYNFVNCEAFTVTIPGEQAKNRKTRNIHVINPLRPFLSKSKDLKKFLFGSRLNPSLSKAAENLPYNRHVVALKQCELLGKDYTLYSWRHTGAVNAYLSGVGIRELQNMFGHSSLEETSNYLKSLGIRIDPKIETYSW